jgi:Fe-Mn family superoxide dismutase
MAARVRVKKPASAQSMHLLPELPYAHGALEPHVDARTMMLHHGKHHASYVANLNAAIENHPELQERSALWLLLNPAQIPDAAQITIRNNAGGHVNHSLFWRAMTPDGGGEPAGALGAAIDRAFGNLEKFKAAFEDAGAKCFGSGWVWLTRSEQEGGKLKIITTTGHGNPIVQGRYPLLLNDVWEHAYYLKHENRRGDYMKGWWTVVDWKEAARRFEAPVPTA